MATLAVAVNPRKLFRFAVVFNGLETAYVQKVKLPKIEIKSAKHGQGPFVVNTASKIEFGQLELENLKPSENSLAFWKDWLALIINLGTGAMTIPAIYKQTITILEFASDGVTIVDMWVCEGAYPAEVDMTDLDKLSENNALDKLKFNVDVMDFTGSLDGFTPPIQGNVAIP